MQLAPAGSRLEVNDGHLTTTTKRKKYVPLLGVPFYDCLNNRTGLQLEGYTLRADNGLLATLVVNSNHAIRYH